MIIRRTVTKMVVGCPLLLLAGCGNPDAEPVRILTIVSVDVEADDDTWRVALNVGNTYEAADEAAAFTDVTALAYDRDGREVGSEYVGSVTAENRTSNPISIAMACSAYPAMITLDAAESLCDDEIRTAIDMWVYVEDVDYWCSGTSRTYGDELPPDPRDDCSMDDPISK